MISVVITAILAVVISMLITGELKITINRADEEAQKAFRWYLPLTWIKFKFVVKD